MRIQPLQLRLPTSIDPRALQHAVDAAAATWNQLLEQQAAERAAHLERAARLQDQLLTSIA